MNDLCKYTVPIQCGPFACVDHENEGESESRAAKIEEAKAKIEREIRRGLRAWPTCSVTGQPVDLEWLEIRDNLTPCWCCTSCAKQLADSVYRHAISVNPTLYVHSVCEAFAEPYVHFEPLPEFKPGDVLECKASDVVSSPGRRFRVAISRPDARIGVTAEMLDECGLRARRRQSETGWRCPVYQVPMEITPDGVVAPRLGFAEEPRFNVATGVLSVWVEPLSNNNLNERLQYAAEFMRRGDGGIDLVGVGVCGTNHGTLLPTSRTAPEMGR